MEKRPHKHEVLTKALTAAKKRAEKGSFVYLVRLAYSLAFNNFNPPIVMVVPYSSPNGNENADTLAEALIEPQGIWWWKDLEPINYKFESSEIKDLGHVLCMEAKNGKVAFCGFKAAQ